MLPEPWQLDRASPLLGETCSERFEEDLEVGIVLTGSEVKSLRDAQVQLKDAYADIRDGEVWLERAHIAAYGFAGGGGHDDRGEQGGLVDRARW